jgi:hypothetical protein
MLPVALHERLDALIDDLIMDGGVEAASMASILLAAEDSANRDYLVMLSRRVWAVSNELKADFTRDEVLRTPPSDGLVEPQSYCPAV